MNYCVLCQTWHENTHTHVLPCPSGFMPNSPDRLTEWDERVAHLTYTPEVHA